jgi:hypothetical protein
VPRTLCCLRTCSLALNPPLSALNWNSLKNQIRFHAASTAGLLSSKTRPASSTICRSFNTADMYNNAPCIIETQVCALVVICYFCFFAVADLQNSALDIAMQIITATGTRFLVYADLRCLNCHQVHPAAVLHLPPLLQPPVPATTYMMIICSGFFLIRQGYQRQVRSPSHPRYLTTGM